MPRLKTHCFFRNLDGTIATHVQFFSEGMGKEESEVNFITRSINAVVQANLNLAGLQSFLISEVDYFDALDSMPVANKRQLTIDNKGKLGFDLTIKTLSELDKEKRVALSNKLKAQLSLSDSEVKLLL